MLRDLNLENPPSLGKNNLEMDEKSNITLIATKERLSKPCQDFQVPTKMEQRHYKEFIHKIYKNNLPLKKRFSAVLSEKAILNNNLQRLKKKEDLPLNSEEPKNKDVIIIPGVIRHTSCPDTYLAYYFNYEKQ